MWKMLWAGAGAPEGVHAGGDGVPWPAAGADFLEFFFAIFYLFSWEFGVLAAMLSRLGPCDSLSAQLTVP